MQVDLANVKEQERKMLTMSVFHRKTQENLAVAVAATGAGAAAPTGNRNSGQSRNTALINGINYTHNTEECLGSGGILAAPVNKVFDEW